MKGFTTVSKPVSVFGSVSEPDVVVPDFLAIIGREWRTAAKGVAIGVGVALLYIVLSTPLFKSEATVMLDTRMNQILQKQDIISDAPVDTSFVDSQVEVLGSESIALAVIKQFNLATDPEFVGPPSHLGAMILWQINAFVAQIKNLFGLRPDGDAGPDQVALRTAVETFSKRLTVTRVGLTYVITIAFESESPERAAKIANAIAETYMATELAARYNSTKRASQWLQDRLTELKVQATNADAALQLFKSDNGIVDTGKGLLNQQQLSDLNSQLILAKTATAQAKARLDRILNVKGQQIPDVTVSDALSNSVITRLRSQYLDLSAKEAELESRLGKSHVAVVKINQQMDEIGGSIRAEVKRIADSYNSDYQIALAREKSLSDSLLQLVGEAGLNSQAQVKMRELESSADAYRTLYDSFLAKFQQATQQQSIPVVDTRIITYATPPLFKNKPKTALALAGGTILGLMMGFGFAIGRELFSDTFRTPKQVETATSLPCLGLLPLVSATANRKRLKRDEEAEEELTETMAQYAISAPLSRFSETLRNIKVAIDCMKHTRNCKVIGVVSSIPREGKSTVVSNLGAIVAYTGARTLVIDGDARHHSLTKALAPHATQGLIEAIEQPRDLASFIVKQTASGLDVLPCPSATPVADSAELIGSTRMREVLDAACGAYDYIFVELPPLASVVDAKAAARMVDAFIYVVEWDATKTSLVLETISESDLIRQRILGVVLNKADPVKLKRIETYKGKAFEDYYKG